LVQTDGIINDLPEGGGPARARFREAVNKFPDFVGWIDRNSIVDLP